MSVRLQEVYRRLLAAFGPQHWWPAKFPFEVVVGAVLVQNTSWRNVERAIGNLREAGLLEPHALAALPEETLQDLIRPAGYFRIKAKRLRSLVHFLVERYGGSLEAMFATPPATLRDDLLAVHGIGKETADSILLYAGGLNVFVVDTYTHRVLARHGWIGFDADYDQIQEYFQGNLPEDAAMYNEFHALLVRLGKDYCRKAQPRCANCPLRELLPEGGPLEE
ncbi:MAG: endonuclease III domain-containing protein [Thermoguttaceae bacterium]|jgi:endonuclease-3 related protein